MAFWYEASKRVLDVGVAGAALVATAPVTLPVAAMIRVTMGSPVLFRQPRPGLGGEPFLMMKFRTMRAPRAGEEMLASDGMRITRLGKALRATSVDELPTLLNVLRGDMSLVGPRPLLMRYLDRYTPAQARRHEVKPGVTGLAQINGRNALSWEEKFAHDIAYVDSRSTWLDLTILARTLTRVAARDGISAPGSSHDDRVHGLELNARARRSASVACPGTSGRRCADRARAAAAARPPG